MVIAYGAGAFIGRLIVVLIPDNWRRPRPRLNRAGIIVSALGITLVVYQLIASVFWQYDAYELVNLQAPPLTWLTSTLVVAIGSLLFADLVVSLFVLFGRLIKRLYRAVNSWRPVNSLPDGVFQSFTAVALVMLIVLAFNDMALDAIGRAGDTIYRSRNNAFASGYQQPDQPQLSGSDASLIPWDKLGYQGRKFVSSAPTPNEIARATGANDTKQPIRSYVGLQMSEDLNEQADMAVQEMKRAGGFDRQAIQIIITTGTGWTAPKSTTPFEYLFDGDTATVAIQYSYLPSWVSFLVDRERAQAAAYQLTSHVIATAKQERSKAQIYLFGESLGSYGAENVLLNYPDLSANLSGTLLVGPPGMNELHDKITDQRLPGSPSYNPKLKDPAVCVIAISSDGACPSRQRPKLIYLQNPSDPVVKWDTSLIWHRPAWIDEQKRADLIAPQFTWRPFITFFQVTVDMILALDVPSGYGHVYDGMTIDAWSALTGRSSGPEPAAAIKQQMERFK